MDIAGNIVTRHIHSINMSAENQQQRQPCEVYSRVVGYLRPVNQWNDGKRNEFEDRQTFRVRGEN
jgi:ribonucleoside-triphosphate reductase